MKKKRLCVSGHKFVTGNAQRKLFCITLQSRFPPLSIKFEVIIKPIRQISFEFVGIHIISLSAGGENGKLAPGHKGKKAKNKAWTFSADDTLDKHQVHALLWVRIVFKSCFPHPFLMRTSAAPFHRIQGGSAKFEKERKMKTKKAKKKYVQSSTIWDNVEIPSTPGEIKVCRTGSHRVLLTRGERLDRNGNPTYTATVMHKNGRLGKSSKSCYPSTAVAGALKENGVEVKYPKRK